MEFRIAQVRALAALPSADVADFVSICLSFSISLRYLEVSIVVMNCELLVDSLLGTSHLKLRRTEHVLGQLGRRDVRDV